MDSSDPVIQSYRQASRRLFLLDYDGVLTPIASKPALAKPTAELRSLLAKTANDERNTVVIVTGRAHQEINEWLGDLPIDIAAEHGSFRKVYGEEWQQLNAFADSWKASLLPILEKAVDKLPRSFTEHKTTALVFHYRNSDERLVKSILPAIKKTLLQQTRYLPLVVQDGKKVIDIHLSAANKGTAIKHWLDQKPAYDFIMIAGDDITDEDMFASAPHDAYTYCVGTNKTLAKVSLPKSSDAIAILAALSESNELQ